MIVTFTINPTIDRVISVDRLAFEDRAYINSTHESPGGRGINASRVIHCFGGKTLALLTSGGDSGKRMEALLAGFGFPFLAIPIENQTRTNLTITDRHGLTVNLNEAGPPLSTPEVSRAEKAVKDALSGAKWLMVCGSIPPGVPSDFYARLIAAARKKKVKTLLHADADSLRHALEEKPTVVTPNQQEAERLLGRTLITRTHYLEAAPQIRAMGAEAVVLSVGSRGAVGAFDVGLVEAIPPRVDAVSPIGAGDALSAAYTWAIERRSTPIEAMRWGVAAGTASACLPGMRFADLKQTEEIFRQVELRRGE
ncbi:MAG TPA: 1-phosphofructokinase family hexose kinase [Candidatus Acidoferrales bacterium]|nr:1-phosphofructokinase family hexose kinase [Candidatus Acidoferrales bacterium]